MPWTYRHVRCAGLFRGRSLRFLARYERDARCATGWLIGV